MARNRPDNSGIIHSLCCPGKDDPDCDYVDHTSQSSSAVKGHTDQTYVIFV